MFIISYVLFPQIRIMDKNTTYAAVRGAAAALNENMPAGIATAASAAGAVGPDAAASITAVAHKL